MKIDKMKNYSIEMSNKLNELLERTYDAEKGYKEAADNVNNKQIKTFFENKAKQRYNFGHELKAEIKTFGQQPEKGGSTTGSLHRNWMNIKNLLTMNEEEAMLQEVERGEKAAIDSYDDILKDDNFILPPSTESLLMRQKNEIKENLKFSEIYEEAVS